MEAQVIRGWSKSHEEGEQKAASFPHVTPHVGIAQQGQHTHGEDGKQAQEDDTGFWRGCDKESDSVQEEFGGKIIQQGMDITGRRGQHAGQGLV